MRLNHNMHSMHIYQNYKKNNIHNATALERVSSGKKINGAKDNPNKIGQSEAFRMQIRGLQMAEKNLQDTSSMLQVADSALQSVNDSLNRMRELAVQSGSPGMSEGDKEIIQAEINQLKEQINYTAKNSEFNGMPLLNNKDVMGNETPKYKSTQEGANAGEAIEIPMYNITPDLIGSNDYRIADVNVINDLDKSLNSIDEATKTISSIRSKYGALQSRVESTSSNISERVISLEGADSQIRDADIALEMAEFARTSVLQNASISILQQSNNFPREVLDIMQTVKTR